MMNDHEVMIFLQTDEEVEIETQVIDLQSKHISKELLGWKNIRLKATKIYQVEDTIRLSVFVNSTYFLCG